MAASGFRGVLGGAGSCSGRSGRKDETWAATWIAQKGRRISGSDVDGLGLCFAPGGARGWLVGQNSSQARELEPELCG